MEHEQLSSYSPVFALALLCLHLHLVIVTAGTRQPRIVEVGPEGQGKEV